MINNCSKSLFLALLVLGTLLQQIRAITLKELLDELYSESSCDPARRAFAIGTRSYRKIVNSVSDLDLGDDGFSDPKNFFQVFLIPASSEIVDKWVSSHIRSRTQSQGWTTAALVNAARDADHPDHMEARMLALELVKHTILFVPRSVNNPDGALSAPGYDGEQVSVLFDPPLKTIMARRMKNYKLYIGDPENPEAEYTFSKSRPLYCDTGPDNCKYCTSTIAIRISKIDTERIVF